MDILKRLIIIFSTILLCIFAPISILINILLFIISIPIDTILYILTGNLYINDLQDKFMNFCGYLYPLLDTDKSALSDLESYLFPNDENYTNN